MDVRDEAELVIVGAGVAGLKAATAARALGLDTLVLEEAIAGGQVASVENIRNCPGFGEPIAGYDLGAILQEEAEAAGARFLRDRVLRIERRDGAFDLACEETCVRARTVIVASGSRRRRLGVPGEAEFKGRGVSHCASCDGPLYRGRAVIVVGGGDAAFDEAETLAASASDVHIVHRARTPRARAEAIERIAALKNVRTLPEFEIVAIEGAGGVERAVLRARDGGATQTHACDGVFVYVGLEPKSAVVGDLVARDERGAILTDPTGQSATRGLFAAGDVRSSVRALLAAVAEDGASAAASAAAYLKARPA